MLIALLAECGIIVVGILAGVLLPRKATSAPVATDAILFRCQKCTGIFEADGEVDGPCMVCGGSMIRIGAVPLSERSPFRQSAEILWSYPVRPVLFDHECVVCRLTAMAPSKMVIACPNCSTENTIAWMTARGVSRPLSGPRVDARKAASIRLMSGSVRSPCSKCGDPSLAMVEEDGSLRSVGHESTDGHRCYPEPGRMQGLRA